MATIDIRRAHTLAKDEAKKRAEELAKGMQAKLGPPVALGRRPHPLRGAERRRQGHDGYGRSDRFESSACRSTYPSSCGS